MLLHLVEYDRNWVTWEAWLRDFGVPIGFHPHGSRAEILSAQANGITLVLLAAWLGYTAIRGKVNPQAAALAGGAAGDFPDMPGKPSLNAGRRPGFVGYSVRSALFVMIAHGLLR